jgi:ABC-type dipeptide/oligopeptide/nickel transport system permease subunit
MATTILPEQDLGGVLVREQVSLWRDGWRRLRRNRLALAAVTYLVLLVGVALLALVWTPYKPNVINICETYATPSGAHPFGCDELGRDSLSRLMVGTQVTLVEGIGCALIASVLGVVVGLAAGYFGGILDALLSLIINVAYGIPPLLVALILYLLLGASLFNIIIAISATIWVDMARLVRGQTLSLREREFIEAARASGARWPRIVFGHIFPNAMGPIIVQATFVIPGAILTGAFLSFLGVGVPPPTADWGGMANEGVGAIRLVSHIVLVPSIALSVTLLAFNFFGDGLRDAFDPRQRR